MQSSLITSVRRVLADPDIAIDLGTANTRLYAQGHGMLADEPSVVQVCTETGSVEAVGLTATQQPVRGPNRLVSPLRGGVVADVAAKVLGVLDNLKRALEAEASVEASESDEFRHFLSGVDLIFKQLSGVLESLGVKPINAVGEKFDPHLHEAVVTEETDEVEPDTVVQEIRAGYRLGDKLIRPALVKVATRT